MANTSILAAFERMWQHVVAALSNKSDISHNHNDLYYTDEEVDTKLAGKADKTHGHAIADVSGLQTALDGKATSGHTHSNVSLGQGYATCSTAASTTAKTASLSNYELTTGGVVSVRFTYSVPASATLNINSKGAKSIYYKNTAIVANVIKGGDTATFIFDGTRYHLITVDRWHGDIVDLQTNDRKVGQKVVTANANYPLLLAQNSQTEETTGFAYFDSGVYLNPSTNKIYADISGNAATATKATQDGSGNVITSTYATKSEAQAKHSAKTCSLTVAGWSSMTQTVSVSGVTASNTAVITPAPASHTAYCEAGVYCSAQANGTLTFTCSETPSANLTVNVLILN